MDSPGRPVGAKYGIPSVSNGVGGPPHGPKGLVRIGAVSTDDCDSTYSQKIFRKYSSQLRMCYEMQLKQTPTLETAIEVEVDILKGSVSTVSIERNEATGDASGSEALGQCVQKKMKRWRFPQDCTGTVQGKFFFKTKNKKCFKIKGIKIKGCTRSSSPRYGVHHVYLLGRFVCRCKRSVWMEWSATQDPSVLECNFLRCMYCHHSIHHRRFRQL